MERSGLSGIIKAHGGVIMSVEFGAASLRIAPRASARQCLHDHRSTLTSLATPCFAFPGTVQVNYPEHGVTGLWPAGKAVGKIGVLHEGRASLRMREWNGVTYDRYGVSGFIDTRGEVVITPKYARVRRFSDGVAWVAVPRPQN